MANIKYVPGFKYGKALDDSVILYGNGVGRTDHARNYYGEDPSSETLRVMRENNNDYYYDY